MRDSEVVAAIVAGDSDGLAEAYDRYASPLYTYCRSLLREPADAADAVQDTFVIAASRLAGLRDQNRLRPWLYTVARNECLRRMRISAVEGTSALDAVPEVSDESVDISGSVERAELRALLRSAVRGLNTGEQDLIELQLRQGLDVAEIADVLGVSRNHVHALLSRARDQLEISLGALLVARTGRQDCAALNTLLGDWDGQLTILMRKRINRHIERCPACTDRKRRELAPALLLGLAPLAALPIAAMPAGLRAQVLRLASSDTPEAVAHRADLAQQTAAFGRHGFPKPLDAPKPWWRARQTQAAAAGAAAVAAAVITGLALTGGVAAHHGRPNALGGAPGGRAGATSGATRGATSGATPGAPSRSAQPTVSANGVSRVSPGTGAGGSPSPAPGGSPGTGGSPGPSGGGSPGPSGRASPSVTAPSSGPGTSPGTPAPSTSTATASSTPSATPPPPKPGTLSVTPTTILLSPVTGGSLTLTASGGPVTWSITEPSSLIGKLTVSPSSGTLASGRSATVALSVSGLASVDSHLTVNPGGISVTVVLSVGVGDIPRSAGSSPGPGRVLSLAGRLVN
jgi:RNA polymerase sigma factor (sigma-70 family)